jgi:hypothetical protein
LLESLIALAIAGLVLTALFDGVSVGMRAVERSERTAEALSHARSHLAALGVGVALVPGETTGDDGGGFTWRHVVAARAGRAGAPALYEVRVDIAWSQAGIMRAVSLDTLRVVAPIAGER